MLASKSHKIFEKLTNCIGFPILKVCSQDVRFFVWRLDKICTMHYAKYKHACILRQGDK